eukprot:TRINITY_DN2346_c0_g1_i1.p1 TRINITY_DN2346_c0_g1~~TRINITY_DN2346_c0_g1_i1.p1  ORF type:complete len:133 (-),score=34.62 TRINITY_DN2346_c0_g1_i1:143-541(-)
MSASYDHPRVQQLVAGKNWLGNVEHQSGDDFFPEWDLNSPSWQAARAESLRDAGLNPDAPMTVIVLYGKYHANPDEPCAVLQFPPNSNATVFDLFSFIHRHLMANQDKIEDGHFLVGCEYSSDNTVLTYFEA